MDHLLDLPLIYQQIYEELNIRFYGKPDETWNDVIKSWLDNIPIYILQIIDWRPFTFFTTSIFSIIFFCVIIRKMIGTSFVRTIPMTSTMNLETSSNQENSQISFDLGELVEKPLRNIHGNWLNTRNTNYQKLYVLTVELDTLKNPSAKVSEIFEDSIKSDSEITLEAQSIIEDMMNEIELSEENKIELSEKKSIVDTTATDLVVNNEHVESRNTKAGSKIPLRVGSRHRLHIS